MPHDGTEKLSEVTGTVCAVCSVYHFAKGKLCFIKIVAVLQTFNSIFIVHKMKYNLPGKASLPCSGARLPFQYVPPDCKLFPVFHLAKHLHKLPRSFTRSPAP